VARVRVETAQVHDRGVWIGSGAERQQGRRVEVRVGTTWRRSLTSELEPARRPAESVVALYTQRGRIEEASAWVKRRLGLAYFWTGSVTGVELQLWAPWRLAAVRIDWTDAVAARLHRPFGALSVERVYRSSSYFTGAHQQGKATDPVTYLAANADWLGVLKRPRKPKSPAPTLLTTAAGA
jgi:hypothetical protein